MPRPTTRLLLVALLASLGPTMRAEEAKEDSKASASAPAANMQSTSSEPATPATVSDAAAQTEKPRAYPEIQAEQALGSAGKKLYSKSGELQLPEDSDLAASDPSGLGHGGRVHTTSSTYLTMGILFMVSLLFLSRKKQT